MNYTEVFNIIMTYPAHVLRLTLKCDYEANWNYIEVKYNFCLIDLNKIRGRQPILSTKLYLIFGSIKFCESHSVSISFYFAFTAEQEYMLNFGSLK